MDTQNPQIAKKNVGRKLPPIERRFLVLKPVAWSRPGLRRFGKRFSFYDRSNATTAKQKVAFAENAPEKSGEVHSEFKDWRYIHRDKKEKD